jgi:glycine betaine/proline transport system permease protein
VFQGLNSRQVGLAGVGGISIVLMAMVLDRITQSLGKPRQAK